MTIRPVLVGVLTLALFGSVGSAAAERREPGVCVVTAETSVRFKSATVKCAKSSSPGRFVIRSTVKERDDPETYRERLRLAGQRFRCDLVRQGQRERGGYIITRYKPENCRR